MEASHDVSVVSAAMKRVEARLRSELAERSDLRVEVAMAGAVNGEEQPRSRIVRNCRTSDASSVQGCARVRVPSAARQSEVHRRST